MRQLSQRVNKKNWTKKSYCNYGRKKKNGDSLGGEEPCIPFTQTISWNTFFNTVYASQDRCWARVTSLTLRTTLWRSLGIFNPSTWFHFYQSMQVVSSQHSMSSSFELIIYSLTATEEDWTKAVGCNLREGQWSWCRALVKKWHISEIWILSSALELVRLKKNGPGRNGTKSSLCVT